MSGRETETGEFEGGDSAARARRSRRRSRRRRRAAGSSRRAAAYLATAGRFGVVWLPALRVPLEPRAVARERRAARDRARGRLVRRAAQVVRHGAPDTALDRGRPSRRRRHGDRRRRSSRRSACGSKLHLSPLDLLEVARRGLRPLVGLGGARASQPRRPAPGARDRRRGRRRRLAEDVRGDDDAPFDIVALVDEAHVARRSAMLVEEHRPDIVVLDVARAAPRGIRAAARRRRLSASSSSACPSSTSTRSAACRSRRCARPGS